MKIDRQSHLHGVGDICAASVTGGQSVSEQGHPALCGVDGQQVCSTQCLHSPPQCRCMSGPAAPALNQQGADNARDPLGRMCAGEKEADDGAEVPSLRSTFTVLLPTRFLLLPLIWAVVLPHTWQAGYIPAQPLHYTAPTGECALTACSIPAPCLRVHAQAPTSLNPVPTCRMMLPVPVNELLDHVVSVPVISGPCRQALLVVPFRRARSRQHWCSPACKLHLHGQSSALNP